MDILFVLIWKCTNKIYSVKHVIHGWSFVDYPVHGIALSSMYVFVVCSHPSPKKKSKDFVAIKLGMKAFI